MTGKLVRLVTGKRLGLPSCRTAGWQRQSEGGTCMASDAFLHEDCRVLVPRRCLGKGQRAHLDTCRYMGYCLAVLLQARLPARLPPHTHACPSLAGSPPTLQKPLLVGAPAARARRLSSPMPPGTERRAPNSTSGPWTGGRHWCRHAARTAQLAALWRARRACSMQGLRARSSLPAWCGAAWDLRCGCAAHHACPGSAALCGCKLTPRLDILCSGRQGKRRQQAAHGLQQHSTAHVSDLQDWQRCPR